jgi:uncharacterized protein
MTKSKRLAIAAAGLVALGVAFAAEALQSIPSLHERVTDVTGTLTSQQAAALDATLAALEQRKGAQVAVLMVPTTAPETIEQYATRVFDAWKLGRRNVNDGVLVIVARNDHRVRIEVAYGLEGAIPDAAAFRIAHEYMTPRFRDGDFAGGIAAGVDMLTHLIDEEPLPPPPQNAQAHRAHGAPIPEPWWSPVQFVVGLLFGGVFGVIVVLFLSRPRIYAFVLGRVPKRARTFAIGVINAIPIVLLMRHPMAGLGAMAAGSSLSAIAGLSKAPRPSRGGGGGGGWSSGGGSSDSGSSGSSSSGSSGGDFSGGGGSSGGGGASDKW